MSIYQEILSWSQSKQLFVQDTLRRIITSTTLTQNDIDELVLQGKDLKGYSKLITRGPNKGKYKQFTATEHKQQFIRDNNIYYWIKE